MRGEEGGELSATCVAPRVPLRLRSLSPNQQRGLIELYSEGLGGEECACTLSAISINDPSWDQPGRQAAHMAPAVAPMGARRAVRVLPHYLQISHLGYQARIKQQHQVAASGIQCASIACAFALATH